MAVRDELAGRSVGEFVLRERIGEGGFGTVYRCEQPLLGREAVVKVLHHRLRANEVMIQRFLREARLASRLDHPYAAHVYAFGVEKDDGLLWIAMEMVHGTTLDRWLRDRGPLPLPELVPFVERIAEVVQTAHERGIVHRDLKPSNVMVIERAGRLLPKLLDLGIAKLFVDSEAPSAERRTTPVAPIDVGHVDTIDASPRPRSETETMTASHELVHGIPLEVGLTDAGAAMGSPPYMAPELWSDGAIGPWTDLYSLGVLMFEALTGYRPFRAATAAGFADLHSNAPVPLLGAGFPAALDRLFARALAKLPSERPASALELAASFRVAAGLGDQPVEVPRLDRGVRDAWVADAPQPLAEAVATLDGARNLHQCRDAARESFGVVVRYLVVLALAARAQVRSGSDDPAVVELLRALRSRDVDTGERVRLLRLLLRPFTTASRGAHPIPELVDLVTPRADGDDTFDAILRLEATSDRAVPDDVLRSQLVRLIAELGGVLRSAAVVLDYALVIASPEPERWMGVRLPRRAPATVGDAVVAGQPVLVDRDGKIVLLLWPLVQALAPAPGGELELFVFEGRGRTGARLVATPGGFERHDAALWDWFADHLLDRDARDVQSVGDDAAPYLGLATFSSAHQAQFVGRERETDAFVNRLRSQALQLVVGASGAGKSSFVNAGVIPALREGWCIVTLRPGSHPIATLAAKLQAAKIAQSDLRALLEASPAAACSLLAHAAGDRSILIVVDQLEELFTLCADDGERVRFAAILAELSASVDVPMRVICTLRDDFLMRVESLPPLRPRLASAVFLLGNPSHDDLVRTIVEPARRARYELSDPDLVREMVTSVEGNPGALALLSFTAARLWDLRDRRFRQLTRKAYEAMGGVGGALGRHADETLAALDAAEQRLVRELFRRLVTAEGTRAQVAVVDIGQILASDRASGVVDKLIAARLLVTADGDAGPSVEVAHEALLTAWPRAQQWIREDADTVRLREQLQSASRQWNDRGRRRDLVWRGELLTELQHWRRRGAHLTELETAFADASAADAVRGRRLRGGMLVVAFAVLAIGSIVLFSLQQRADETAQLADAARQRAELERARSHAQLLESREEQGRRALLAGDTNTALVFLDEARRMGADSPALRFMIARAMDPVDAVVATLRGHGPRVVVAAFSPDGTRVVTAGTDGTVRMWDASTGVELARLGGHAPGEIHAAWSPDGARIASIATDGIVRIWRPGEVRARELALSPTTLELPKLQFSPDGRYLAAVDPKAVSAIMDVERGVWTTRLASDHAVYGVEFSPGSDRVALAGTRAGEGVVGIWRVDGRRVAELSGHKHNLWFARFSPDGKHLVSADLAGTARVWSVDGRLRLTLRGHEQRITHVAISPASDMIATVSADRSAKLWSVATGELLHELRGHTAQLNRAVFTPDGLAVITVASDGTARVWDTRSGTTTASFAHEGFVFDADLSRDGKRLVTASWSGTARVFAVAQQRRITAWSPPALDPFDDLPVPVAVARSRIARVSRAGLVVLDYGEPPRTRTIPIPAGTAHVDLSPDGALAVIAGGDDRMQIVTIDDGRVVRELAGHRGGALRAAFAPDGRTLASYGADGTLALWDLAGTELRRREVPKGQQPKQRALVQLQFSPDGGAIVLYELWARVSPVVFATATLAPALLQFHGDVQDVVFAPDSRRVAVASGLATTVESVDGGLLSKLDDPAGPYALAWHPQQTSLLVGSMDRSVALWNPTTWKKGVQFDANDNYVIGVAYSHDGALFATAGGDKTIRIWDSASHRHLFTFVAPGQAYLRFDDADRLISSGGRHVDVWRANRSTLDPSTLAHAIGCRLGLAFVDGKIVARPPDCVAR